MGLIDFVKRLVDPTGPIGEVASPSEVYKTRLGLPISSPHTQRVQLETTAHVERALAPARFIVKHEADVPKDRVRLLSAFVEEHWTPVYETTDSTDFTEIARASQNLLGWRVTQHVRSAYCDCTHARFERDADGELVHQACGRSRKHLSAEEFAEIIQQQQIQPTDEFYNVYLDTVPGNDPVMINGEVLKAEDGTVITGGTQIKHGRAEYRHKTKGFALWDKGFMEKRKAAMAEEASRPVRNVQRALEAVAGRCLPMHRSVGISFRKDRRSGV